MRRVPEIRHRPDVTRHVFAPFEGVVTIDDNFNDLFALSVVRFT
jgi:hypothetical protein